VIILYFYKIQYVLVEEHRDVPDLGRYRSFGIMALRHTSRGRERLAYVPDVTTDRAFAAALARRCNRAELSPIHLRDFIADTLGV